MRADLSNADLTPVKLRDRRGHLTGAEIAADLSEADLTDATLDGADLSQANSSGSSLDEVRTTNQGSGSFAGL